MFSSAEFHAHEVQATRSENIEPLRLSEVLVYLLTK